MKDIKLTSDEKKEIEKRGFFVKKNISFLNFVKSSFSSVLIAGLVVGIPNTILFYAEGGIVTNIQQTIAVAGFGLLVLAGVFSTTEYIKSSSLYFTKKGVIGFGRIGRRFEKIESDLRKIKLFDTIRKYILRIIKGIGEIIEFLGEKGIPGGWRFITYLIFFLIWGFGDILLGNIVYNNLGINTLFLSGTNIDILLSWIVPLIIPFSFSLLAILLGVIGNILIKSYHPLYAFGNLGEKIQRLTPLIEDKSKLIQ